MLVIIIIDKSWPGSMYIHFLLLLPDEVAYLYPVTLILLQTILEEVNFFQAKYTLKGEEMGEEGAPCHLGAVPGILD